MREKVIRGEREHCEFVLIISKGFPEFWGWLREVVRLKSRRLDWKQRLGRFMWRDKHTDSNLARNPGKGSCFLCFRYMYIVLCFGWLKSHVFHLILHCLIEFLGFFPETAWRFKPYRQAAHQWWTTVLILVWIARRRWVSARRRDTIRVLFGGFNAALGECN